MGLLLLLQRDRLHLLCWVVSWSCRCICRSGGKAQNGARLHSMRRRTSTTSSSGRVTTISTGQVCCTSCRTGSLRGQRQQILHRTVSTNATMLQAHHVIIVVCVF